MELLNFQKCKLGTHLDLEEAAPNMSGKQADLPNHYPDVCDLKIDPVQFCIAESGD
jgi:hypothetical protein